jgi:hypothetical protein
MTFKEEYSNKEDNEIMNQTRLLGQHGTCTDIVVDNGWFPKVEQ